jgi:hypothetical protein
VLTALFFVALLAPAAGWDSLRFLQGDWIAEGGGQPGQASAGSFGFQPDLDGKILVRKNRSEYPATKDHPAVVHRDLMVIYPGGEGKPARADYWDNEGHAIRYTVTADGKSAVFLSEEDQVGPRFRLSYAATGPQTVSIKFEVAPPGKPFQTYVEGSARRK